MNLPKQDQPELIQSTAMKRYLDDSKKIELVGTLLEILTEVDSPEMLLVTGLKKEQLDKFKKSTLAVYNKLNHT